MSSKRPPSPTSIIPNPFIKKRNLEWTIEPPRQSSSYNSPSPPPNTAAIESGDASVTDHLTHFRDHLARHTIPPSLLPVSAYAALYQANQGSLQGAHFVIHQHDHPVAGTHYDLRLQINETSSVSWAIMYGLPGDANSVRLNRNATETRVHCLWNHLIETASSATGSLLIWDTGTYSILPRKSKHAPRADPSSPPRSPPSCASSSPQALLHNAFQSRKIRLRLHGSKLPDPYVLNLRLTKSEDATGRAKSSKAPSGRRRGRTLHQSRTQQPETSSDEDDDHLVPSGETQTAPDNRALSAMEREIRELEDEQVRLTNAYTGASNTIGSVHQRKWYLSLDRPACGFVVKRRQAGPIWEPSCQGEDPDHESDGQLSYPFYVEGVEHERSVVTGRRGADILRDEGVNDFIPRKGWVPVLK